tara:strand:+ start:573 stop:1265 length:693 start_codon:yes stop_codon:yes gene_type:complete
MEKQQKDSNQRFERKYTFSNNNIDLVLNSLRDFENGISQCFPTRQIHSFYFDTPELTFARENIEGFSNRKKLRFRCYGDLSEAKKFNIELKVKNSLMGSKIINSLQLDKNNLTSQPLHKWLPEDLLPQELWMYYYELIPTVRISYTRQYLMDSKNDLRITLDTDIVSTPLIGSSELAFDYISGAFDYCVLEVKYGKDALIDYSKFIKRLPFRLTRHSKYLSALETFNLVY